MSFVWKSPNGRLKSPEQCARECLEVARARNLDDFAAVLAVMCIAQESDFWCPWNAKDPASHNYSFDSESDDGRSVGYFQQQNGAPGDVVGGTDNWWGSMASRMNLKRSCDVFLDRLEDDYMSGQGNPARAGELIQHVQSSAFPGAYTKHYDRAVQLVEQAKSGAVDPAPQPGGADVGFTGDPVWLEDVLHDWLGNRLVVHDGWAESGVGGTMGDIWGVMIHHTGNSRETVEVISNGRPDLAGPLSQGLITPDGKFHLVAVGPCNHAGIGSYPGIGTNNGNNRLIGFECAWPDVKPDGSYNAGQKWPDAQIVTMRDATAAVLDKLGYDQSHVIGHKEWATRPPNVKWDPGNVDMDKFFRPEVGKALTGQFRDKPGPAPVPPTPSPTNIPANSQAVEYFASCAYWEMLGWRTQTEALAVLLDAVTGSNNAGKPGVSLTRPKG